MAEPISLRLLDERDVDLFWAVRLRMLRDHPEAFGSAYEEALATPREQIVARMRGYEPDSESFLLGAVDGRGELVGTIVCVRESGAKSRHKANIYSMYVAPEVRGRGIGRRLLGEAIGRARSWGGVEQLHLTVVSENAAARQLYLSHGFEVYGLERHALKLPDRYLDEELMVLFLERTRI